jgi:uncharacterized protein YgiM (DUF1202 family)
MRIFFFLLLVFTNLTASLGQSYLGWITKEVNFRQGPGPNYGVISSLQPGTQIFIVSLDSKNDFYNIIDIETDKEGFVNKSFVRVGEAVKLNDPGLFTPTGKSSSINPAIEIYNNTSTTLTLKMNSESFTFQPNETRKIIVQPGSCNYRASAPGVIPYIGTDYLSGNTDYSWQFYIVTSRD